MFWLNELCTCKLPKIEFRIYNDLKLYLYLQWKDQKSSKVIHELLLPLLIDFEMKLINMGIESKKAFGKKKKNRIWISRII